MDLFVWCVSSDWVVLGNSLTCFFRRFVGGKADHNRLVMHLPLFDLPFW